MAKEVHAPCSEDQHAQKNPPVAPALDIRCPIGSLVIMHGDLDNFQSHPGCAKQKIKVTEWIEIAEEFAGCRQPLIMRSREHFRAAQGVFETLPEDERKRDREDALRHCGNQSAM